MIPLIFIAGYSNSGKTTVAGKLIRCLKARGYRVAAIKHAPHGYKSDPEGKDSWRYYEAGADSVAVVGQNSYTLHRRCPRKPGLGDILKEINNVDIIVVEGFKSEPGPKIEVCREGNNQPRLPANSNIVAVVSDKPVEKERPYFAFEQTEELADFIITNYIKTEE
ncbi:MAG: molybdopterin-guanine dinucleotide biosynthesis protein B [Bacillota bacterium]|jgi:molybdopterin-guanine dinucleotide biosynthesis protein B